jgi:hypothetical protein
VLLARSAGGLADISTKALKPEALSLGAQRPQRTLNGEIELLDLNFCFTASLMFRFVTIIPFEFWGVAPLLLLSAAFGLKRLVIAAIALVLLQIGRISRR